MPERFDKIQTKDFDFDIKQTNVEKINGEEYFRFSGYLSTFGNVDRVGDVVMPGAFAKSIVENPNIPILLGHDRTISIGTFPVMKEDNKGLYVEGLMPMSDTFVRERVIPQMRGGGLRKMSIGYRTKKWQYSEDSEIYYIIEAELYEGSLVTVAANNEANINPVKCLELAEITHKWDKEAAKERLKTKNFTENEDIFDVVNGEVKAVPKAIFSLRVKCLRDGVRDSETVKAYYKKMGMLELIENNVFSAVELKNLSKSDQIYILRNEKLSKELAESLSGLLSSEDGEKPSVEDKIKAIQNLRNQLKEI